jgi:hypothetical protein
MLTSVSRLFFSLLITQLCWCQQAPPQLSARELFYHEKPDNDKLPSPAQAHAATRPAAKTSKPAAPETSRTSPARVADSGGATISTVAYSAPPVQNFGLRYNVLLVNTESGKAAPADPDRMFQPKECLALEFETNRSGYLYVFEQASSGKWGQMFPSAELPDESNVVKSRTKVRVPAHDCFEVSGEPGVERVFVVLSRKIENFYDLRESVKSKKTDSDDATPPPVRRSEPAPILLSQDRLGAEISRIRQEMQGRELRLKKVSQPESADEPANSVYVVNSSTTPSERVITEIQINHR